MNIKTNNKEIVAVVVPEGATDIRLSNDGYLEYTSDHNLSGIKIGHHKDNFNLIGILSDLTEQQAADYAEIPVRNWLNCSAKSALDYTLTINGLDTNSPILIIEKV